MVKQKEEERVLICYGRHSNDDESLSTSFTLQDPRGVAQAYLLRGGQLHEVHQFKQAHSSWCIGTQLIMDGSCYLATPVDPVFAVLPSLEKHRNKTSSAAGVFCDLLSLLDDPQWPGLARLASSVEPHLGSVCDIKDCGGDKYYRLNDDLVLAWLTCKVAQASTAVAHVTAGMDEQAQLLYALGWVGEYVSKVWLQALAHHYKLDPEGINCAVGSVRPSAADAAVPPEKKPKLDPKEAARKKAADTKAAQLAKQAAGTLKISNFFKKPATK